jgi:site-specific recombinase XerD
MTDQTAMIHYDNPAAIINLVLADVTSENSKRAYRIALEGFLAWYKAQGNPGLSKITVNQYKAVLVDSGLSGSSINLKISAIRRLAQEASDNGLIEQQLANGIANVKGVKQQGNRVGNWLTKDQAQDLINQPELTTNKGLRDRAILAVMIGAGLRRSEVANLSFAHIQQRESRWVILDMYGKGNRVRTIPIPSWVKETIDEYSKVTEIETEGFVFRRINKGDNIVSDKITPQAIRDVVNFYSNKIGFIIAPHDLRRTYAKLAHKGGAGLDQIQLSLGHSSIQTTERYLGITQSLIDAPCDHLGLKI